MTVSPEETRRSKLRDKGQLTLPTDVREALHVQPGDDIEFELRAGGDVVMRGLRMIPAEQAWFWTETWQAGEREATADIAAGRVETFEDSESFLEFLKVPEDDD